MSADPSFDDWPLDDWTPAEGAQNPRDGRRLLEGSPGRGSADQGQGGAKIARPGVLAAVGRLLGSGAGQGWGAGPAAVGLWARESMSECGRVGFLRISL